MKIGILCKKKRETVVIFYYFFPDFSDLRIKNHFNSNIIRNTKAGA